jgi:hypothetical protein
LALSSTSLRVEMLPGYSLSITRKQGRMCGSFSVVQSELPPVA